MSLTVIGCSDPEEGASHGKHSQSFDSVTQGLVEQPEIACTLPKYPENLEVALEVGKKGLTITVDNPQDAAQAIKLRALVVTAAGAVEVPDLAAMSVAAKAMATLDVSAAKVGLSNGVAAQVYVVAVPAVGAEVPASLSVNMGALAQFPQKVGPRALAKGAAPDVPVGGEISVPTVAYSVHSGGDTAAVGGPAAAQPLALVAKTLCFSATLTLIGSGVGEDFWTSGTQTVSAKGQFVWGLDPATNTWTQFQLDQSGCWAGSMNTGTWTFDLYAWGKVVGATTMTLDGKDFATGNDIVQRITSSVSSSSSQTITYTSGAAMTTWHIVHASLLANLGALTTDTLGTTFKVQTNTGGTGAYLDGSGILVATAALTNKWDVSHEVGRVVMFREAPDSYAELWTPTAGSCNIDPHAAGSKEWNGVANVEGFASFWAASQFNRETEADCFSRFSSDVINCAAGSATYPQPYMETQCATPASLTGLGNETDWQRAYWNLVDESGPTMRQVLDFIEVGSSWNPSNHYTVLNNVSNAASTPDALETRWDTASVANGIDH